MARRQTRRELAAQAMAEDEAEMRDRLYHAGHTPIPVYTFGDHYVAVGSAAEARRLEKYIGYKLTPHGDEHVQNLAASSGWKVWIGNISEPVE